MKEYVAAVDLGGTKIALGLFDEACTLVAEQVIETRARQGPQQALDERPRGCGHWLKARGFCGIR